MPTPKENPAALRAAAQDILAATWELQDLARDVAREARNLANIMNITEAKTIKITIKGGAVQDVDGLPEAWQYEINDLDA